MQSKRQKIKEKAKEYSNKLYSATYRHFYNVSDSRNRNYR